VFATARPLALSVPALPGGSADGVSEGNRPAALPPGLSSGLELGTSAMPGRSPTDSGDVSMPGVVGSDVLAFPELELELELEGVAVGAAVTVVASDTCGSLATFAAAATAVRLTDVTVVADVATVTFACS